MKRDRLTEPITLPEAMLLVARDTDDYRVCVRCGGQPTEHGIVLLPDNAALDVVAWCSDSRCQDDRANSEVLTIPIPTTEHGAEDPAHNAALTAIGRAFRDEADPSTTGIWREACDLLDRLITEALR